MQKTLKKALDLFNEQKFEEALAGFLELEKHDSRNPRILNNIGLCYAGLHSDKAEEYYAKALALDPKQAQTYVNAADFLFKENRIPDAIELLQNAVYELPEDVTAHHYLARIYIEDKRYEDAIAALDTVLELSPKNPDAHWDLGMVYFELGDWYSAIASYEQVVETVSSNPVIYYQLGLAYEANNEIDKAMTAFFKALAANQNFPLAYKKLGMLFMARNDINDAVEYFENYMNYELPEIEKKQVSGLVETLKRKKNG